MHGNEMARINILTLFVLVEDDVTIVLHITAARERAPQCVGDRRVVLQVVRTQDTLDVLRSLLGVVERHLREDVVADVSVGDVVEGDPGVVVA